MANKQANERDDVQKERMDNKSQEHGGRYEGGRGSDQDRQAKQGQEKSRKEEGRGDKPAQPMTPDKGRRGMEEEE